MTVLLVDDQIRVLSGLISGLDWDTLGVTSIRTASSAAKAKEILSQEPVDILLCDIEMPGENGLSLLECDLITGRTHQLRVHFAHLGCPLAGDDLYGGSREHIGRHALHCACIRFAEPASGETVQVESPLPPDMAALAQM